MNDDLIRKIDDIEKASTKMDDKMNKHVRENAMIID